MAQDKSVDRSKMQARLEKMDFWQLCGELGRVVRRPGAKDKDEVWSTMVIKQAQVPAQDIGYIRERRLRIGMDECSVVAALGKPTALNRTNTAGGRSDQMVYRARGMYVYTENGRVRAWQE